jgi:7-cyano-7-deazaguanine synthase
MKSVVLLSGGLDSTVLLAQQAKSYGDILALSFDYGQTHRAKELAAAKTIAAHYGVKHRIVGMSSVVLPSALTGTVEIPDGHAESPDATTVPARNMIFISIAAAVAESENAQIVYIGTNASDHAGYADCRPGFIRAMWKAVSLGTDSGVTLSAPLSHMSKREIVGVGRYLDAPMHLSWSCYRGGDEPCNRCGACEERNAVL